MNRPRMSLVAGITVLLLVPLASGGNSQWTTTTERETTTAAGDLLEVSWFDDDSPHAVLDVHKGDTLLFGLDLAMHDGEGGRLPTTYTTQGSWLIVGQEGQGSNPGPVGLKIHDVPSLAAKLNCHGHPPDPIVPPEPIRPAPCVATFPTGSTIVLADDGRSFEVQLPREEDGSPGAELSWTGFNPQPEPPAVDGDVVSFVGENVHVGLT